MHASFATIKYGPFKTVYHKAVVDGAFREALSAFLEHELLPQVDEAYNHTKGRLTAVFNEEKYCGPNSAVRDVYELEFSFVRRGGADTIEAEIYRDPKTSSFRPRFKGQPLILWTEKRKAEQLVFREAIDHIVRRIHAGGHSQWMCPRCSAHLVLIDSADLFDLRCPQGCFDYNFHRNPETREFMHGHFFSQPPRRPRESAEPDAAPHSRPPSANGGKL